MRPHYDVVVVGAGPAGSTAARFAANQGAAVALLEKDREIGVPVRCAEGISAEGLGKYVDIDPRWIAASVTDFGLYSPAGKVVKIRTPSKGYILHRRLFDHSLAELAALNGAEVFTKAYVYGLQRIGNTNRLFLNNIGRKMEIEADIVIAADGVESRIARFAGIKTKLAMRDIESCAQMMLSNIDINQGCGDFYFSHKWAPGGYVWVFPKGDRTANVGLGVNGTLAGKISALEYLESFVSEKFPGATRLTTIAGGVPVATHLSELVTDGLMVVGDAAHQVNPLTGGGISSAMAAGKMAGLKAAEAIKIGNFSKKALKGYQTEWNKTIGKDYKRFYRLKEWTLTLTDKDYEDIAEAFQGLAPEEVTMTKIFKMAVRKKPSLLIDVMKVFAGF